MSNRFEFVRLLSVFALITLGGAACGGGDGSTEQDPGNQAAGGRWSDTGDYSYDMNENNCDTGSHDFSSQRDYCLGLEDDALNQDCAIDLRMSEYASNCGDDFQENNAPVEVTPPIVNPDPVPTPPVVVTPPTYPTPTPSPSPSSDLMQFQVVRDLAQAGITVQVQDYQYGIPGIPNTDDYLPGFWDTLLTVENQLISRKPIITTLIVSTYTDYSADVKLLTLSSDMTTANLVQFFTFFDRLQNLQKANGVSIDTGIMLNNSKQTSFDAFDAKISALEKYIPTLTPAVQSVEFETSSYTDYELGFRKLLLGSDSYATDLAHYSAELSTTQSFFKMIDSLSISIDDNSTDFDKELSTFNAGASVLLNEKASLTTLAKSGTLSSIEFSDQTNFYPSLKRLMVPTSGTSVSAFPLIIESLAWQSGFTQKTGITFNLPMNLDENFSLSSQHLMQVANLVQANAKSIQSIAFGQKSQLLPTELVVGTDSIDTLRQVILSASNSKH